MRKALIVGINHYPTSPLNACIPDANRIANIIARDFDNTPNFHCKKLISSDQDITKTLLKESIIELYDGNPDVTLFYFSGHGCETSKTTRASLVTQDAADYDLGVEFDFLLQTLQNSTAKENIIILDCCFSGSAGNNFLNDDFTFLREGTSILTSSQKNQVSFEDVNGGVFTHIICNALEGGAADTLGLVNVAGIYSYADKLLGPWDQRPVFKSYVSKMISLRKCKPFIALDILRKMPTYFPTDDFEFRLDPTFEPQAEPYGHDNEKIFSDLQKYNRASLLVPVDEEHMYFAAINNKSCVLTPLGKYYWKLAKEDKL